MSTRSASATRSPSRRSTASYGVRIVQENVSVAPRAPATRKRRPTPKTSSPSPKTATSTTPSRRPATTATMPSAWPRRSRKLLKREALKAGTVLRVGLEVRGDVRQGGAHQRLRPAPAHRHHRPRRPRAIRPGDRARAQSRIADGVRRHAAGVRRARQPAHRL